MWVGLDLVYGGELFFILGFNLVVFFGRANVWLRDCANELAILSGFEIFSLFTFRVIDS